MIGPDGDKFVWGKIVDRHVIGDDIEIVEYKEKVRAPTTTDPAGKWTNESYFHPYVREKNTMGDMVWEDTRERYPTLDTAIVGALATKYRGFNNNQAAYYACIVLGIPVES
jgi:hypothetical protein